MSSARLRRSILLYTDWFDNRFNQGVARYAREQGWSLSLETTYGRALPTGWRGDGCIAIVIGEESVRLVRSLGVPTVDASYVRPELKVPRVNDDDHAAGRMAAHFFAERGYRQLAFCAPGDNPVYRRRHDGFVDGAKAVRASVVELLHESAAPADEDWAGLRRRLRDGLVALPKPCGVFCVDDRLAAMVCEVAEEEGLPVPGDFAVLGVGNLEIACECSRVPLSSIGLDPEAHGYAAAGLLDEAMSGKLDADPSAGPPVRLLQPVGIIERASTQGVAVHDPALSRVVMEIIKNPAMDRGSDELARIAGVGRQKLYDLFAAEFRCTPGDFVERVRLRLACRLLAEPHRKLFAVAEEAGFGTTLRMHRAFRRCLGQSPGGWRKLAAEGKAVMPAVLPEA